MTAAISPEVAAPAAPRRLPRAAFELLATPRRALVAAVLIAVGSVGFDALSDPDVWWHIRLGQWILANHRVPTGELFSYTAAGNPLTAHEWLSDLLFAALNSAGGLLAVAVLVGVACWSGFLALVLRGARRGAGPIALAIGLALGAKAAEPVLGARPQVFTFVALCWMLVLVDSFLRRGGRRIYWLPAIFLLWANLHAGFVAGLAVLLLVLFGETLKRWMGSPAAVPSARIRVLLVCTVAAAAAACINPSGPSLYHFALSVSATEGQKGIAEWLSPNFHDPGLWALLALIVTFAILPALGARLDLRDAILAGAGTALALTAVRDTAICVALVTPAWMAMAADAGRTIGARTGRTRRVAAARVTLAACLVGAAVVLTGAAASVAALARTSSQSTASGVASAYPSCAAALLARSPTPQRVFAVYGSAGYLIYQLFPSARVYEYGESISLGFTVFADYTRIAAGSETSPSALTLLAQSRTTAVLYPAGELTALLEKTPHWTHVLSDPSGLQLYVHGDASWAAGAVCPASPPVRS